MTDIIQELRGLIAKATPGPWSSRVEPQSYPECDDKDYPATISGGGKHIAFLQERYDANLAQVNDVDAALIVAAINHLPALLDRLEAAERVANAARDYASNYLLDEREDPTLCFEAIQHERIIELFDALDAPAIREER